jgi:uncharacterized membrane protein YqjE
MAETEGRAGGLLQSIRNLAGTLLAAGRTRLEILATDIEEERLRLEQLLFLGLTAVFFLGMGLVLAVAFIVIYFWDTHRLITVGTLTFTFLATGAALGLIIRGKVKTRPKPFAATRGELAKDEALLREPLA